MNTEVINAFNLCRGKVFQYKQQLFSRFCNDHVPVQYGVDYSSKLKEISHRIDETQLSPRIHKTDKKPETYETVSKIQFQNSPTINRKIVQISKFSQQKQNEIKIISSNVDEISKCSSIEERHKILNYPQENSKEQKPDLIFELNSPINRDTRILERFGNQLSSSVSEQEVLCKQVSKKTKKLRKDFTMNRTDRNSNQKMFSADHIDRSLVSVAERAKSLMNIKTIQASRLNSLVPHEEVEESVLSIKDRIKLFKDNLNQSAINATCQGKPQKNVSHRFKTQPLSFDDIARANAMILDQNEASSTIASPSMTNSIETLIDFSEDSNSYLNQTHENQKLNMCKSINEETMKSGINVKDFIQNCDKNEEVLQQKYIKNAVVSRKLTFKSKAEEDKSFKQIKSYSKLSHLTQPITKLDMESRSIDIIESNQSIKDRISQIKTQSENNWKSRCRKDLDIDIKSRPSSVVISSLQEQLQITNDNWKNRVEQKDVDEFSADSKLGKFTKKNNVKKRYTIHEPLINDDVSCNNHIVRLTRNIVNDNSPRKQTLITDIIVDDSKINWIIDEAKKSESLDTYVLQSELLYVNESHKVILPNSSNQSLSNFFSSSPDKPEKLLTSYTPTNDDFDEIFLQADLSLNINKRSVKPTRHQKSSSRNPLKKLNERSDIRNEYEEKLTGIAERELKHCQIQNIQSKAGFAEEALAGLTAKEDFSKIKLKRTDSNKSFENFISPYKDLMLISVKGRKNVQVRLVEPTASSINIGDCYLLLTKQYVFVWIGECANIIEINKVNELGSWITKCKELNYIGSSDKPVIVKSDDNEKNLNVVQFWKCLHYDTIQMINFPGDVSEDELYEKLIQTTNMVFRVIENQLVPCDEYWGAPLKHKMLMDDQVFIFDFGTELYLWSGFKADMKTKTYGRNLLKILFSKGFNYESCSINPLDPLPSNRNEAKPNKGSDRPNWIIVGRLAQKGETTLFKEKFSDWPETSRLIKNSFPTQIDNGRNKSTDEDLQPINIGNILNISHPTVSIIIDGKSVSRGGKWKVIEDGIMREFSVSNKNISMWHITDNEAVVVPQTNMGQFFSNDAYIIRWDYELTTHGRYTQNNRIGNILSAFFFWQGISTSITEKTASALLTIGLDKDHATQIRVKQNHESPAFCRLFDGSMVVHIGKQQLSEKLSRARLFIIRGEIESEAHFIEVSCESQSLRDRSVFLLINNNRKRGFIWSGNSASSESKSCASYCLKKLLNKKPVDFRINYNEIKIEEIDQGQEPRTFWEDMGIIKKWKSSYSFKSLVPLRGWFVSGLTGVLNLTEMIYSLYPDSEYNIIPAFPLLQTTLYKSNQPALFLIWTPSHLFIWEGWWVLDRNLSPGDYDVNIGEESEVKMNYLALPKSRIVSEKLALLKSVDSWLNQNQGTITSSIVYAGLEPISFQELFPFWEIYEDARNINLAKGYTLYQEDDVTDVLNKYLTMTYSVDRLRERPLPENVISSRIESYLTQQDFEDLFKMTKNKFYELSPWKQYEKKKEVNLF